MWKNTARTVLKPKTLKPKTLQTTPAPVVAVDKVSTQPPWRGVDYILPGGLGGWVNNRPSVSEATYFTVLRVLSEALGKLPVHVRDMDGRIVENDAERLLNIRPNDTMTPSQLMSYAEYCRNHYGNAYIYCDWRGGKLTSLTALDPRSVRLFVDDSSTDILQKYYYTYITPTGNGFIVPAEDIVHVKSWHIDDKTRMLGIPVRETLMEYMSAAIAGQDTQNNLYKNGMISSGVLLYDADYNEEKKAYILEQIKKFGTTNKIIPLPKDWDLKTINLSLADAQYLETRKFTSAQIAAAFGVPPNFLNDYSKGSYANATAQQLAFLTDTLMFITKQYEDEMSFKLLTAQEIADGLRVDIDTEAVLQSTPDALADILCKYVGGSIYTINEARRKAGLPPIADGDQLMAMPGATTVTERVEV